MSMPFEIFSVFVRFLVLFQEHVILLLIDIYINSTCEGFHVLNECLKAVFSLFLPCLEFGCSSGRGSLSV